MEIGKCFKSGITPVPGPPGGYGDDPGLTPYGSSGPADATKSSYPEVDKPVPKPRHNMQQDVPPPSYTDPYAQQRPTPPMGFQEGPPPPTVSMGFQERPTPPTLSMGVQDQSVGNAGASGGYEPAGGPQIGSEQVAKAQRMCKFASSSLDYEDVNGAVNYLTKALHLLKTGKEL